MLIKDRMKQCGRRVRSSRRLKSRDRPAVPNKTQLPAFAACFHSSVLHFTSLHFQEEEEAKQQEQRGDEDAELRQGRAEAARERRAPHPHALLRRRALPHQGTLHPDRSVSLATRFTFAPSSCDLMIPGGWLAVTIGGDGVEPEGAVLSRRAAAAVHHIEAGRDGAAAGMYPSFFFFASSSSSSSRIRLGGISWWRWCFCFGT
jgi:hypothetical protein